MKKILVVLAIVIGIGAGAYGFVCYNADTETTLTVEKVTHEFHDGNYDGE